MIENIKGIIFDLDGVICFTDKYHYQAWKKSVEKLGVEFNEEINNRLRGVSRMDSLNIILEKYDKPLSQEEKEKLCSKKNEIYKELLKNLTPDDVTEDVLYTLKELRKKGIKTAIGSSSKNTKLILNNLGITGLFDAISDGNNISKSKPDPEVFLKAAEMLALEPRDCAVVEDALSGIEAAKRGGFYAVAISDAVKSDNADMKINMLSDII